MAIACNRDTHRRGNRVIIEDLRKASVVVKLFYCFPEPFPALDGIRWKRGRGKFNISVNDIPSHNYKEIHRLFGNCESAADKMSA